MSFTACVEGCRDPGYTDGELHIRLLAGHCPPASEAQRAGRLGVSGGKELTKVRYLQQRETSICAKTCVLWKTCCCLRNVAYGCQLSFFNQSYKAIDFEHAVKLPILFSLLI
ncbi:hypothetical protein E2C01_080260 [Portunus trituberculatus]|uniref:Uncharacterized protein n=1 Tax=Portunus trituberculatus TaxID=210409 RepID=A0A5B7INU2_PORTR|nr:hypothetical protein [Portunus trituberculatus]